MLAANPITKDQFAGVFAADMIRHREVYPSSYVVNTDKSGSPGTHWIAIHQETPETIELFDSFGAKLKRYDLEIQKFCNKFNVVTQDDQIQSSFSTACGQYACFFIYKRCTGRSFTDILRCFNGNQLDNDVMVTRKVNDVFDVNTKVFDKQMVEQCVRQLLE